MLTNLPLHVHGLFSIAPDRGRLSFTRGSDDLPTKWNTFMFTRCVASAWLKLLDHRSKVPCHKELFAFWPKANFDPVEMWDRLDDSIIDLAITHNSQVWNVCSKRCVAFKDALFGIKNAETATYGSALVEARTPAVYPDEPLFKKLVKRSEVHSKDVQILSPTLVRRFLRSEGLSASLSDEVASRILEFCILDAVNSKLEGSSRNGLYRDLHDISLWPMLSGKRTAPDSKNPLLLPRDSVEMRLFAKSRASSTLNTSKLRPSVQKLLLKDIEHLAVIMRHRDLDDLAQDWPVMYPIALDHRSENWVLRPPNLESLLCDIWAWIFERIREGQRMSPTHSGSLWLVPVNGGRVRKYQECKGHPILLIEKQEPLFPVLTELASHQLQGELPIFDTAVFTSEAVKSFRNDGRMRSDMNCAGVDQLDTFVDWLVVGKKILAQSSEHAKETLLGHLEKLTRDYRGTSSMLRTQIRQLPLYSKVSCVPPFRWVSLTWSFTSRILT